MEVDDTHLLVALCHEACEQRCELNTRKRRGSFTFGTVFWSICHAQVVTFSCFWLSYLCVGQRTSKQPSTLKWKQHARLGVYLSPSPSHARSVALELNPHTGHVSPQFHIIFDNFFEMISNKPTDLDAPEPDWKYLSSFAVRKGHNKTEGKGLSDRLLVPRRVPVTAMTNPSPHEAPNQPTEQRQEQLTPVINKDTVDLPEDPLPADQPTSPLPHPQPEQPLPAA